MKILKPRYIILLQLIKQPLTLRNLTTKKSTKTTYSTLINDSSPANANYRVLNIEYCFLVVTSLSNQFKTSGITFCSVCGTICANFRLRTRRLKHKFELGVNTVLSPA